MDDVTPPFKYSRDSRIKFYLPQTCTKKGGKKKLVGLIVCIGSLSEDHRSSETHQYRSDESWESNRPYNRAYRTIIVFTEAVSLAYQYARLERKDGNYMLAEVLSLQEF